MNCFCILPEDAGDSDCYEPASKERGRSREQRQARRKGNDQKQSDGILYPLSSYSDSETESVISLSTVGPVADQAPQRVVTKRRTSPKYVPCRLLPMCYQMTVPGQVPQEEQGSLCVAVSKVWSASRDASTSIVKLCKAETANICSETSTTSSEYALAPKRERRHVRAPKPKGDAASAQSSFLLDETDTSSEEEISRDLSSSLNSSSQEQQLCTNTSRRRLVRRKINSKFNDPAEVSLPGVVTEETPCGTPSSNVLSVDAPGSSTVYQPNDRSNVRRL